MEESFKDALYKAILKAIEEIGIEELKKLSWFGRNR